MATLIRYRPLGDVRRLNRMMDRFIETPFLDMPGFYSLKDGIAPVDVYQTENEVIVKAVLPGVSSEDVSISVTGDTLTIRGEVREFSEGSEEGEREYHLREHRFRSFHRSLMLPTLVDANKAEAEIESGILTLTLPKAEEVKPKMITVKAK